MGLIMGKVNLFIKRLIDVIGSLTGIIILSPVFLIVGLAIKMSSKGSIIFKQDRLGCNGRVFKIYKFRTMVINAENMGTGLTIKNESDSRITGIGKILRKTSMDELPQLFNVIIGDMSLVGPRPPVPYHPYIYEDYSDIQRLRFTMRPGITGLAQITVRNSVIWDKRIEYDIKYVDGFNIWLDMKILCKTVLKLIKGDKVYN